MKKKHILIILIVIVIIAIIAGITYFIVDKVKEQSRNYEIETISEYKYFVVRTGDKYGVIDSTGQIIIDATYDEVEIPNPSKDVFICYQGEQGKAYNANKQQLFAEYNSISAIQLNNVAYDLPYEKSVLKCEKNGMYGLIDFSGNKILDTEYDSIESFSNVEGQFIIEQSEKFGIANMKGTILVEPEYDTILGDNYYSQENGYKYSGYIVGIKNTDGYQYGYINYKGSLKLEVEYNDISRVTEINDDKTAYLISAKNGQYGVSKDNKQIINNEYQDIEYDDSNNIFIIQKGENYGVANIEGNITIPVENSSVQSKGQYIYIEKDGEQWVCDASGNKVDVDFNETIMETSNENYKIIINTESSSSYYGVIDANNNEIIKAEYLYIEYAFDNYFIACGKNGKLGMLDSNGNAVIELKYDLVQKMQNKNMVQTLIADTNTTELYSSSMQKICTMDNATIETQDDYVKVYSTTELHYYNSEGTEISSSKIFTDNKLFAEVKDGKWGYVDSSGATKVEFEYEMVTEFNEYGYAAVKKDGKWGCIDSSGNIVLEPTYEMNESYSTVDFIGEYIRIQSGYGNVYYTNNI